MSIARAGNICTNSVFRNGHVSRGLSMATAHAPSITLFQYNICPFCHKTKALLEYAGVQYSTVEVNPLTKQELKSLSGNYKKVPIAKIDGEIVNGSDKIIDMVLNQPTISKALAARWNEDGSENQCMSMEEFRSSESAIFWKEYASDELAALLYPNICRSLSDSYQAFGYVRDVDSFSPLQKVAIRGLGSLAMYFAASKVKSKRGIIDERKALEQCLTEWEEKGLKNGFNLFSSGKSAPNIGDVSMFGTLQSIDGLQAHSEVISNRVGATKEWYDRMNYLISRETISLE
eukprot:CAMPEP_0113534094 /NCGR_PEP_ID=MMETSP0015_2-20120614/4973_1 /TAXON_ID=2838 /ORGANISM="Odontella" /LENGTH=288 /DNA_ID=CAMNT_0000433227 /DNA_START=126 /DNA_END=992 /DNA_ORIENTATION=- /assembly_acc=CAM_ASM_000160